MKKDILRKGGIGIDVRCGYEAAVLSITAKLDRGNMALPDGSKGQDETKIFGSETCLVRMRNDRRVKQCHRFNGIFSGEECSD